MPNGPMIKITFIFISFITTFSTQAQQNVFTREDSLRGTINAERKWWDVTYYHLDITIHPENKSIEGKVQVTYKVIEPHQVLQIDLQPPLVIQSITQDNQNLTFHKDGRNAYIISLRKDQNSNATESIIIHYAGNPLIADNPPWEG